MASHTRQNFMTRHACLLRWLKRAFFASPAVLGPNVGPTSRHHRRQSRAESLCPVAEPPVDGGGAPHYWIRPDQVLSACKKENGRNLLQTKRRDQSHCGKVIGHHCAKHGEFKLREQVRLLGCRPDLEG